ncbi:MAG TPA: hypothetical protein VGS16_15150 [Candidatus Dormibacteraeota bacterium]|nr:hypothetical protein [Candidatus Dormibacteraeota bacterium]
MELAAIPRRSFNHPLVGALELQTEWFAITGSEGQLLVVYHADPDSPSEHALSNDRVATAASQAEPDPVRLR